MIQKKDLPQQTKRKGILALFWEGFLEGFNTPKEEQARQLSKNYKEVQHLKMQEGETVDAETVAPEQESGWTRFVAGFKEGWNEPMISEKIEKKIYPNSPVTSPFDPRIVSDPYDPNVTFSPFNPFNEDFSDPRHDLYEYFYGDD